MNHVMKASLAAGSLLALAVGGMLAPALAASPAVEAAIKSIGKIETDGAKFQAYCKLIKDMADVPDNDTAKEDALEAQFNDLMKSLGADVAKAWETGNALDPASADGQAFGKAVEALEDKCPD